MISKIDLIINSQVFLLALTVGVYYFANLVYKRTKLSLLNPILVSMAVIIPFLKLTGISYESYMEANRPIDFLLGLSVVALGYLLYENIKQIEDHLLSITFSVFIGSLIGVCGVIGLALIFDTGREVMASLQPKSVTTPIALALSSNSGGIPALTSIAVIITGILGSIIGPWLLKVFKITDPVAKGLAMGSASHAVGTAKAMEMGAVEGAVGGAAIGLMGLFTAIIIPLIEWLIHLT